MQSSWTHSQCSFLPFFPLEYIFPETFITPLNQI
uniref:Uncharacterized protein n=1 Tax=Arundo donax TaxID=35708 RepID=A0A0A9AV51_ARUDO